MCTAIMGSMNVISMIHCALRIFAGRKIALRCSHLAVSSYLFICSFFAQKSTHQTAAPTLTALSRQMPWQKVSADVASAQMQVHSALESGKMPDRASGNTQQTPIDSVIRCSGCTA